MAENKYHLLMLTSIQVSLSVLLIWPAQMTVAGLTLSSVVSWKLSGDGPGLVGGSHFHVQWLADSWWER